MINSRHFVLASVLCAGCTPGELRFARERLDLGAVLSGTTRSENIKLISRSSSRLRIAGTSSSNPNFSLLHSGDVSVLVVNHTPPPGTTERQEARLRVWTEEGPEASLEVTSTPVAPDCEGQDVLDFGVVKSGEFGTLELVFTNETPLDTQATVNPLSDPSGAFVIEHGRYPIRAGGEVKVPITFQPPFSTDFAAQLTVQRHSLCTPHQVTILGTGVTARIEALPRVLTWSTGLGMSETQLLIVRNSTLAPVALFDVQTREGGAPSQVFRALRFPVSVPAAMRGEGHRLIPGEAGIEVSFTPAAIQDYLGQLSFSTDLAAHSSVEVTLAGFGR